MDVRRDSFNLVIERLLISGKSVSTSTGGASRFQSRYRAASHFRLKFQTAIFCWMSSFNLVIERLLISGAAISWDGREVLQVSISLSSGFSFQEYFASALPSLDGVSISLSSGFSFQANQRQLNASPDCKFQSRYRAASHFRHAQENRTRASAMFQSRYRAASHFRAKR